MLECLGTVHRSSAQPILGAKVPSPPNGKKTTHIGLRFFIYEVNADSVPLPLINGIAAYFVLECNRIALVEVSQAVHEMFAG